LSKRTVAVKTKSGLIVDFIEVSQYITTRKEITFRVNGKDVKTTVLSDYYSTRDQREHIEVDDVA